MQMRTSDASYTRDSAMNVLTNFNRAVARLHHINRVLHRSAWQQLCYTSSSIQTTDLIQVTPKVSLFDQKVHIKVQGLPRNAKVTLHLSTEQEWRREPVLFVSCSHHVTSPSGEVDLNTNPSSGGTYTGLDPMGLFWSLRSGPDGPKNTRLVVKNVEEPLLLTLSVFDGHLSIEDLHMSGVKHQPLSAATVTRLKKAADVRRIVIKEGSVRGVMFLPPGSGPHPGVIDMFGSAGGVMEIRAALLASHGFATLALPFFRYDDLPASLDEVDFKHFTDAAEWMSSHKSVKKGGIGVVGVSKGAEYALLMGWKCPQVTAVVQINGAPFCGIYDLKYDGKPFMKGVLFDLSFANLTEDGLDISKCFSHTPDDIIPIWESSVPVLTLISNDDGQLESCLGEEFRSMFPESKQHLIEVVQYPGAGHLLEPPYTPHCRACINPAFDINMLWGGHPVEHARAQEDAWPRILNFLSKHLS